MASVDGHQAIYGGDEGLRHHLCVAHGEHMDEGASREALEERHEGEHEYSTAHRGEYSCPDGEHDELNEPTELTDMHDRNEIGEIHRGIGVSLPDGLHRMVHDPSRPLDERARALLEHVSDHPEGDGHLGTHWTTESGVAEDFAETAAKWKRDEDDRARPQDDRSFGHYTEDDEDEVPQRHRLPKPGTAVVFHAHPPSAEAIDRNPHRWGNGDVYGYSEHGEREVPIASSHDLSLRGISWAQVHAEEDPDERHWWPEYEHHDFGSHEPREAASADDAMHLGDGSALVDGMACPGCGQHVTRYRDYWWNDDDSPHDCDDFRHEPREAAARTASADRLPEEAPGLYWRAHIRSAPFDAEHAQSHPVGPGYDGKAPVDLRYGYSCFSHPYHLAQYMPDHFGEDSEHREVLAFHGRHVGTGHDGEPLVVPEADHSCCGQVVHDRMP